MELDLSRLIDALPGLVWTALPDGRAVLACLRAPVDGAMLLIDADALVASAASAAFDVMSPFGEFIQNRFGDAAL